MTREEFVSALKAQTSDAAIKGTLSLLRKVPGRSPRPIDVELSNWFAGLAASDVEALKYVIRRAAELTAFSFLCVFDGVSPIENGPAKGALQLRYLKNSQDLLLNDDTQELLHDTYNAICQQSES